MDFKLLQKSFEKDHTTRYIYTEYNNYHLKWAFENFEKLVSKPTFQATLTTNLDFQINQDLIHQIDEKIDEMRAFFQSTSQGLEKYLAEVENEVFQAKTYLDFLNNFYKGFKNYMNDGLIPWIFANVMHDFVKQGSLMFDPKTYLDWIYAKFEYKLMQKMRLYLKGISVQLPSDQIFRILIDTYDQKLFEKQKELQVLKQTSLI